MAPSALPHAPAPAGLGAGAGGRGRPRPAPLHGRARRSFRGSRRALRAGGGGGAMGLTRQKHAKKNMGFYKNHFHFREPFQVLLDGTFCQAALRNKIQIREQLPGYLDGATQLCTTR